MEIKKNSNLFILNKIMSYSSTPNTIEIFVF